MATHFYWIPAADQDISLEVHFPGQENHQNSKKRGDEALGKVPYQEIYEKSLSG